MLKLGCCFPKP